MPLLAKAPNWAVQEQQCPPGVYDAVCVDVIDDGYENAQNKTGRQYTVRKLRIVFEVDLKDPDGKPYLVVPRYSLTLGEKSFLRRDIETWIDRMLTPEEALAGIDIETFIGQRATIKVIHNKTASGRLYAQMGGILKPKDTNQLVKSETYTQPQLLFKTQKTKKGS